MKKSYLWHMNALVLAILMSIGFISCGDSDREEEGDDPISALTLTVNGANSAEHTFPGLFDGGKGIDYKQVFKIKSNVQWTLSGKEDWLNVSPTSGNGEVDLSIYPTKENDTDTPREATITLSGSGLSITIHIKQEAGKPTCYVLPANEVALYDCVAWEYNATSNVNEFQYIFLSEAEYSRMTDRELLEELKETESFKYADQYLSALAYDSHYNRITENSTYYFVSVAYDINGEEGALQKTKIKTPAYKNADDDAWVSFSNLSASLYQGFSFDVTKEGYCNSYHVIYGIGDEYYNRAVMAFEINYYIKNEKKHWLADSWDMEIVTNYPNNHTFTYSTYYLTIYPICFAYGWGVFQNGTVSSDITGFDWDTSESQSMANKVSRKKEEPKNVTLVHSIEVERAKRIRAK